MKKYTFFLLLLSSCSIKQEDQFLVNLKGTYIQKQGLEIIDKFSIDAKGSFTANGIQYKLKTVLSQTNAVYLLDDIQLAGILLKTGSLELKEIWSTTREESGIDWKNVKSMKLIALKKSGKNNIKDK